MSVCFCFFSIYIFFYRDISILAGGLGKNALPKNFIFSSVGAGAGFLEKTRRKMLEFTGLAYEAPLLELAVQLRSTHLSLLW